MPTGDALRFPPVMRRGAAEFDPGAALAILDGLAARDRSAETASARNAARNAARDAAWDAAWIACLTNSPRWAEAARREFVTATGGAAVNGG